MNTSGAAKIGARVAGKSGQGATSAEKCLEPDVAVAIDFLIEFQIFLKIEPHLIVAWPPSNCWIWASSQPGSGFHYELVNRVNNKLPLH